MKLCKVSELTGSEKLARPIMTLGYQELLAKGTVIKKEYIPKILQLGINEVFIEDEGPSPEQVAILKESVGDLFKKKVKSVLERHIYTDSASLKELTETADSIIKNILENDSLVEQIYDIKERSADIYEHSVSVCSLSVLVAIKLKLKRSTIHDLGVASLFHDIGLRYLDFDYQNTCLKDLSEKNLIEFRKHPAFAYTSLEKEKWLSSKAKTMILQHHERLDGSGYPLHVREFEKETEILQVCDAFDEMICGIGCERAKVYEAVEFLKVSKYEQFSAEIVDALLEFTAVYPAGTVVLLNSGEMGVIIRQNKQFPERPVLNIIKDQDGNNLSEERICDLLQEYSLFIEKVIM